MFIFLSGSGPANTSNVRVDAAVGRIPYHWHHHRVPNHSSWRSSSSCFHSNYGGFQQPLADYLTLLHSGDNPGTPGRFDYGGPVGSRGHPGDHTSSRHHIIPLPVTDRHDAGVPGLTATAENRQYHMA